MKVIARMDHVPVEVILQQPVKIACQGAPKLLGVGKVFMIRVVPAEQ
jgi:hypothetical protein